MTQTLTRPATVSPPPPAPPRRKKHRDPSRYFRLHLPLVLYLLFTLIPFYWMLVFAFRPTGETTLVPWPITFEHFDTVWNGIGFGLFFQNSLIIGVGTLVVVTVFALMGGYALARFLTLPAELLYYLAVIPRRLKARGRESADSVK